MVTLVSIGILFIDRSRQGINNVAPQLAERRGADHRVTTPRGALHNKESSDDIYHFGNQL